MAQAIRKIRVCWILLIRCIRKNGYQLVYVGLGLLIGVGLTLGHVTKKIEISDYSNKLFESLIPLLLLKSLGFLLLVTGVLLLLANKNRRRFVWLYHLIKPVLRVFNDFCEVFILVTGGLCIVAFIYYFPFESNDLTKSMVLLCTSILGIYSFNNSVQNLIHGAVIVFENPSSAIKGVKWLIGFLLVIMIFYVVG